MKPFISLLLCSLLVANPAMAKYAPVEKVATSFQTKAEELTELPYLFVRSTLQTKLQIELGAQGEDLLYKLNQTYIVLKAQVAPEEPSYGQVLKAAYPSLKNDLNVADGGAAVAICILSLAAVMGAMKGIASIGGTGRTQEEIDDEIVRDIRGQARLNGFANRCGKHISQMLIDVRQKQMAAVTTTTIR